jgi:F-type H+-transporting ATPase subunit gamma
MAGLKEIKRRLTSVNNTKKITYAMKLVAAAKLRKVQDEVVAFRAYRDSLYRTYDALCVEAKLLESKGQNVSGDLLQDREVKNVRLLVVGGFRGLAGGYNSNVSKAINQGLKKVKEMFPAAKVSTTVIGKKAIEHVKKQQLSLVAGYEKFPDSVGRWPINELIEGLVQEFREAKFDRLFIIYTEFKTALSQNTTFEQIVPFKTGKDYIARDREEQADRESVKKEGLYEPSLEAVFQEVVSRMIKAELRYAALNSQASEHGSRMTAMDAATKNANELADKLRLKYNKLRQSGITAELLDIIGGSEAIK